MNKTRNKNPKQTLRIIFPLLPNVCLSSPVRLLGSPWATLHLRRPRGSGGHSEKGRRHPLTLLHSPRDASKVLLHNLKRLETHIFVSRFCPFLISSEAEHVSTAFPSHFALLHWHPDPIFDFRKLKLFVCLCHYSEIHIVEFAEEGCKRMKKNTFEYIFFLLSLYFSPPQNMVVGPQFKQYHDLMKTNSTPVLPSASECEAHAWSTQDTVDRKLQKLWLQSNAYK